MTKIEINGETGHEKRSIDEAINNYQVVLHVDQADQSPTVQLMANKNINKKIIYQFK